MGAVEKFAEIAQSGLSKAIAALEAIAEVKAIVGQVQTSVFQSEQRMENRFAALETRIRELERENAKLGGQVQAGYSEALKTVFVEYQKNGPKVPRVGDGSGSSAPRLDGTGPKPADEPDA